MAEKVQRGQGDRSVTIAVQLLLGDIAVANCRNAAFTVDVKALPSGA